MHVVEIQTQDHQRRFVVINDAGDLVEPIVQYLKYLDRIGSARNTLRAYATALRLYWQYLEQERLVWQQITLDDLARFVLWLKVSSCPSCRTGTFQPHHQSNAQCCQKLLRLSLADGCCFHEHERQNHHVLTSSCQALQRVSPSYHEGITTCEEPLETKGRETTTTEDNHDSPGTSTA